jgi:uncharacterized membrane protein YfcA
VGGGALVAPALYVLLGMTYVDSVALSLIYSAFTKVVSAVQHARQGTVLWKITLAYGLAGIPGAILGSTLIHATGAAGERVFPFVRVTVLVIVGVLIVAETAVSGLAFRDKPLSPSGFGAGGLVAIVAVQLVVGVLMGATSVGSGSLVILSMVYLFRMTAKEIVGSNIVIALFMVVPAGVTHWVAAPVNWRLLALLLVGSLAGAVLGSRATMKVSERVLKLSIAGLVLLAAAATLMRAW